MQILAIQVITQMLQKQITIMKAQLVQIAHQILQVHNQMKMKKIILQIILKMYLIQKVQVTIQIQKMQQMKIIQEKMLN